MSICCQKIEFITEMCSRVLFNEVKYCGMMCDVQGALPSTMMDRTSDDSGLTSDDTWERKTDLMTQSASALYKCASIRHAKKPGKPG